MLQLLDTDDDYAGAGFALALVHEGLDELALAETRYRESIERSPDHVAAYLNLAALLERQRRGADAIEVLEACLALELDAARRQQLEDILDAMKATR